VPRLALLVSVCVAACVSAPTAGALSLSWSGPQEVDPGQALSAVACPSLGLCVAVDGAGRALVSTSPRLAGSWSQPFAIRGAGPLRSVSCATSSLCVALDGEGRLAVSSDPSAPGSGAWSQAFIVPGAERLTAVACPASTLCVAVDGSGHATVSAQPGLAGPGSWSQPFTIGGAGALASVSCASPTLCAAVDKEGHVAVSTAPAAGASAWRVRTLDAGAPLVSVSCFAGESCVALDAAGSALASADAAAAISAAAGPGSGATWSTTAFDPFAAPAALSCAATGLCVALDGAGFALASDDPTAAPPAWAPTDLESQPGPALAGVSCAAEGLCAAVDAGGRAFTASVPAPTARTGVASEVTQTTALLAGLASPNDATPTACRFEYGPSDYYGASVPCTGLTGAGVPQAVGAPLAGLAAGAGYHYRLVVSTAIGTGYGTDQTFTTVAPRVVEPHPSIDGIPAQGQHLTCRSGVSSANDVTLAYAWLRDTRTIGGAGGASYLVGPPDVSHHLQCRVTASAPEGARSANSVFVTVPAGGLGTISETYVGAPRVGSAAVSVPVVCSPQAYGSCTLQLRLAVQRTHHATATVGASTARLRPGARSTATVRLNASGRRTLAHAHRLTVGLSVSGTVVGALRASLRSATVTFGARGRVARGKASGREGASGRTTRAIGRVAKAAASTGLALTPYMGWDSYFTFGGYFDEASVLAQASQLLTRGLERAGYRYVWLDVGWWHGTRTANGEITVDPTQWPHGMAWLARTLHAAGFRVGLYTDAGSVGCGGPGQGSYGHYQQDVNTFAAWGIDAVKVDYCGGVRAGLQPAAAYAAFHGAIVHNARHRPMLLSICDFLQPGQFAAEDPAFENSAFTSYAFGPGVGNSWRTDTDVGRPGDVPFENVLRNLDADAAAPQAAGPGHWNDPDYLGPDQGMSEAQFRTQFSMWAMLAAPLMVSADLISLGPSSAAVIANREAIAIDQDPAGLQGRLLAGSGEGQVWVRPLSDGSRAVALLNRGSGTLRIETTAAAVGMAPRRGYQLRNVWTGARANLGSAGAIAASVPGDSTVLLRVVAR
jgi:hypothetical protein